MMNNDISEAFYFSYHTTVWRNKVTPLLTIGDVHKNDIFARISAHPADDKKIYIAFRHINFNGLRDVTTIEHLLRIINDTRVVRNIGITRSFHDALTDTKTQVLQSIVDFIRSYEPREVIFTGYSFGASLALAAAILTKRIYLHIPISVYQFAGTKLCNATGRNFANKHLKKVVNVVLRGDPVQYLPISKNLVHVGEIHELEMAKSQDIQPISLDVLVRSYINNTEASKPFKTIHLAGERFLYKKL